MMWIVVSNSHTCQLYDYNKQIKKLTLVKTLNHPESKLKGTELNTDGPGHFATSTGAHGSFSPKHEPQEIEIDDFSREIANALSEARKINLFTQLIIAAQPRMNGLITKHLESHVKACVLHNIIKDCSHLTESEMLATIDNTLCP